MIMLSLENAASGTNLVEATHIILIDPVAGTKEQAQAVEAQAIGRAHRMGQDKQARRGTGRGERGGEGRDGVGGEGGKMIS